MDNLPIKAKKILHHSTLLLNKKENYSSKQQ